MGKMKAVVQRVTTARVTVQGAVVSQIGRGVLVLLGVEKGDREGDAAWLAKKVVELRLFEDQAGKMNLALADLNGSVLAVSQFTLAGNCAKGRRPSFDTAASPEEGKRLYDYFVEQVRLTGTPVQTGIFQADMQVELVNDGPVTFILDSPRGRP
jgi:D-aminoacyl-tRNA deacylase